MEGEIINAKENSPEPKHVFQGKRHYQSQFSFGDEGHLTLNHAILSVSPKEAHNTSECLLLGHSMWKYWDNIRLWKELSSPMSPTTLAAPYNKALERRTKGHMPWNLFQKEFPGKSEQQDRQKVTEVSLNLLETLDRTNMDEPQFLPY